MFQNGKVLIYMVDRGFERDSKPSCGVGTHKYIYRDTWWRKNQVFKMLLEFGAMVTIIMIAGQAMVTMGDLATYGSLCVHGIGL